MLVIKVGGRVQSDETLVEELTDRWNANPGSICVVHGGGDEISETQRRLGLQPKMQNGRRVTTADDLTVVRMVLSGLVNKRIVASLVRAGISAVGVSGEDGGLLRAAVRDDGKFGLVGATPDVNPRIIKSLLSGNHLPVISPVSACQDDSLSDALNVNGDDAAAAIATALEADELLFISDVAAVRDSEEKPLSELDEQFARELMQSGAADGGMAAKLEAALAALEGGVKKVRIGALGMLRDPGAGTHIRSATGVVR